LAVFPGGATNSLSSSINPKSGFLKITFGNGNGKKTTDAIGAILQDHGLGGGYFVTSTNAGAISLTPTAGP
jgi:ATP:corrinoid adenosyltransferase